MEKRVLALLACRKRTVVLAMSTAAGSAGLIVILELRAGADLGEAMSRAVLLGSGLLIVWLILAMFWPLDECA